MEFEVKVKYGWIIGGFIIIIIVIRSEFTNFDFGHYLFISFNFITNQSRFQFLLNEIKVWKLIIDLYLNFVNLHLPFPLPRRYSSSNHQSVLNFQLELGHCSHLQWSMRVRDLLLPLKGTILHWFLTFFLLQSHLVF